jgi:hypothetical protein
MRADIAWKFRMLISKLKTVSLPGPLCLTKLYARFNITPNVLPNFARPDALHDGVNDTQKFDW